MYELRTSLYDNHVKLGAKIVEFGGFQMPLRYSGDIKEHTAVREAAGLFDVSHMGEVRIQGTRALDAVQKLITNDASKLYPGKALYSPMCYTNGTVVDDVLVYMLAEQSYLVVINASNIEKDYAWMLEQVATVAELENAREQFGLIALQGPKGREIGQRFFSEVDVMGIKRFHCVEVAHETGSLLVSRTGYTGEDGLEIYCPTDAAPSLWDGLMEAGKDDGLLPCGLGARDSLRLEAGLPLYGHELSDEISPLEAGLGWTVKLQKRSFNGKEALAKQKDEGPKRQLVGLVTKERRAIPRAGYKVFHEDREIGTITSGIFSPTRRDGIALALVEADVLSPDGTCEIEVRDKRYTAQVTKPPFVRKQY